MDWKHDLLLLCYVALGGALGSVARFLVAKSLKGVWGHGFPWEMVFVNTFGCILVGLCAAFLYTKLPHPRWAMLLYWGFIGGFTAFSSFIKVKSIFVCKFPLGIQNTMLPPYFAAG